MNRSLMFRARRMAGLVAVVAGLAATAPLQAAPQAPIAAPAAPLALADYLALPEFSLPTLSPNGRYLAVASPVGRKRNLTVIDLDERKGRPLTGNTVFDVMDLEWVNDDYLVYALGRLDAPNGPEYGDGGGLFVVKRDGTNARTLVSTWREQLGSGAMRYTFMSYLGTAPDNPMEILVETNLRGGTARDVYRIYVETGARKLLTFDQPGRVVNWVLDKEGLPRAAVVIDDQKKANPESREYQLKVRATMTSPWQEMATFVGKSPQALRPVGFAPNNQDLIVASEQGKDTKALYLFDVGQRKIVDTLAAHPRYDIESGLRFDPRTRDPVGVTVADEMRQTVYFDETYAQLQGLLEAQFPGQYVNLQRTLSDQALVVVSSDRQMPIYYRFDEKHKKLEELMRVREKITAEHLVQMRPFLLKTRDGLEIPSYYFLPKSHQPGQKLPTVVHVHGGPHARADFWGPMSGFGVREAQILASRGYAVVLPNFRITPGLGRKIYRAGFGEVGRKMSEDHEDAANWAVTQGFADPDRMCISGASYGGYATLWALAKTPDLFKCGVAGLLVSDFETQLTSSQGDTAQNDAGVAYWRSLLGLPEKGSDWSRAHEISPARHAEKIKRPLFIYAGRDDYRTPMQQTNLMVEALKKAGHPPEVVMVKEEEGHGYGKVENNVDLYTQMLQFLDKHIGSGWQKK